MRELSNTVTLQGLPGKPSPCNECLCYGELGDCPRGELMFWREIWLERMNEQGQVAPKVEETCQS